MIERNAEVRAAVLHGLKAGGGGPLGVAMELDGDGGAQFLSTCACEWEWERV